jgi:DNA (cytosine-5)-methyltransferase 1
MDEKAVLLPVEHVPAMALSRKLKCISLFAGGGGLQLGLAQAGFETVFATDIEPCSAATFRKNFPTVRFHLGDIRHLDRQSVMGLANGQIDLIAGGPPCQGFTTIGDQIQGDIRNALFEAYLRVVRWVAPKAVLIENVNYLRTQYGGRGCRRSGSGFSLLHLPLTGHSIGRNKHTQKHQDWTSRDT